jgi:hypothetical protein
LKKLFSSILVTVVLVCGRFANAETAAQLAAIKPPLPLSIEFINEAADVPGVWDPVIRSEFVEAMNISANDVSRQWRKGSAVTIGSDIKSGMRLYVVDHPLSFAGRPAGGFHYHDAKGSYAIFDLTVAAGVGENVDGSFLFGSHELDEMLADPSARAFLNGYYMEIADPVVCCHYEVTLSDGAVRPLNDFVLRSWFQRSAVAPFDFIDSPFIVRAFEKGPGGTAER